MKAFSAISSKESLDEVSKKIRGAMQQRRERRRSEDADLGLGGSWSLAGGEGSDGAGMTPGTPGSEEGEGKKNI